MKILPESFRNRFSFVVMLLLIGTIILIRALTLLDNELSWDVFGYYIHLPAAFIYHDYQLENIGWIKELLTTYPKTTGSLYQLSTGPDWNPIFFFLMGMSFFYAPWFFIGHLIALSTGAPADGLSIPYQYTLAMGAVTYTIIGLIYFRKILLSLFSDKTTVIILFTIVLGTNYLHFMTVKNLETANILFMLVSLITWNTLRWHKDHKSVNLIAIAVFTALAALSKPSEILVLLVPFFWGVYNNETFKDKLLLIKAYRKQFYYALATGFVIVLPQMIYWFSETGHFVYDSYKNPGVGLDLLSPHILPILFSFKKGWLLYTPVMIFAITGFVTLYRKNKSLFGPVFIYSLISFYIIASWTEWWYGASYSIRPMITLYPLLAIPLGFFIEAVYKKKAISRIFIFSILSGLIFLNLFQTWQMNNYVLDPYRMTRAYYFATFGRTEVEAETRNLLSFDRDIKDQNKISNEQNYTRRNFGLLDFETPVAAYQSYLVPNTAKGTSLRMDSTFSYSPDIRIPYRDLTSKDHLWIRASVDILLPAGYNEELPILAVMMDRRGGAYYYHSFPIDTSIYKPGQWGRIEFDYLTQNLRSTKDRIKCHVWHRGKTPILIDNLKADVFEPKD